MVAKPALKVSAFRNTDGSRVVEILNTGMAPVTWEGVSGEVAAYVTNEDESLGSIPVEGGTVTLLPHALTTVVLR
ncbi:glycoside hydrolase family 30 beta sandwich domain-containing protein [Nonomuraea helvata]|uniref:Glycoside hydrolase family 30 beta sandwich domain-containing protein n=1 Tax=Nonomuraea helvata TaxID=37484 RepID=A0ABV5RTJ4_9ACTN